MDINEQKKPEAGPATTERALRLSELSYRRLFEAAQDGILILDVVTGRITDVNPFLTKLLGFSHAEMVGQTVGELSPFKDMVSNQAMLERLQQDRYVRYENLPLQTRDGRHIAVEFVSNIYQAGDFKVIQCNVRDITKRKLAEDELLWKTTLLEAQLDSSIDGILVVDTNGHQLLQNRRMADLWKIPEDIIATRNETTQLAFATSRTKNPAQFMERINHLYAHPDEVGNDEIELVDGTILDRYSAPVRDKAGRHYGRIWSFRDITERRKLDFQLRQAQKIESIGQLAGGIAHDFNNILTATMGYLHLAKIDSNQLVVREYLGEIERATVRAADLVSQILTFSRQSKQERQIIELNHVVLEALKLLRASVPATIRIQTELTRTPTVLANATAVHQVIMNLGTNAWHAMRDQIGVLKVEMDVMEFGEDFVNVHHDLHPGRYVRLSVSDTGCGMERVTIERIFDPFFTTKPVGEGTGLGLAVVHGIMKSHDGGISVYSHPGEGTSFHLYFPVFESETVNPAVESVAVPPGHGERILFVDDELALTSLGKRMLERLGYRVTTKNSSQEALSVVAAQPGAFDLVVTDLTMPVMDGAMLCAKLLQLQPQLPIILTTGYSHIMTPEKIAKLGFRELVNKPSTARTLGEAVHRVLSGSPPSKI